MPRNGLGQLEVTGIPWRGPPAAPNQTERSFGPWAEDRPESQRDILSTIAGHVDIEGTAGKVGRPEGVRSPSGVELELLPVGAARSERGDDRGNSSLSKRANNLRCNLSRRRFQSRESGWRGVTEQS